ncbi:MAG: hypothetical protein COU08_03070 [Candidatus Harrisonbacteria bacterium CG10_big_fil_rev_8_21_14_0_10_42_17]|uniref:Bacillithiol system redox-active protein YtxJ n=1 Tax=Candidatus Harrisonbacteria bacterium CG10_big_fil_rev_8_21_14_0_10_42_17 TaxID=1974584 RepID=A0A2M6WHK0_9BACT|nr:MAG: hypothetical protein COU08_03070 [Candidatus Harrisonbacteria bacterium CG10_big_fil_rev_8_21_14_0_10_42_17]
MKQLVSLGAWGALRIDSRDKPIAIFKHSVTCVTSLAVLRTLLEAEEQGVFNEPIHLLVTQDHPDVSDAITHDLKLPHETPQVILMKHGVAVYSETHYSIIPEVIATQFSFL